MTLAELKSALSRYGFDESDPLTIWINAAINQIVDEADVDWVFLETEATLTVTAYDADVALPADCAKIASVRDTTDETSAVNVRGWDLTFRDFHQWNRIENHLTEGLPQCFTLLNVDTMRVFPVPTTERTLNLMYHKKLTELSANSDVPEIPSEYHYTIVRLAAATALMTENEEDRAETALALYGQDLDRMKMKYASRQISDPEYVQEEML